MSEAHRDHPLILASGSPRRRELLAMLGLPFRVVVPAVDETRKTSEVPDRYVVRIARDKALAVARREPEAGGLAAGTPGVPGGGEGVWEPRPPPEGGGVAHPRPRG